MDALVPVLILASGPWLIFIAIRGLKKISASKRWPVAEGNVASSQIGTIYGDGEQMTTYWPDIDYEYSVRGVRYSGSTDRTERRFFWHRRARKYVSAHPPGTPVRVYYDPNEPRVAVLNHQNISMWVFMLLFGMGLTGGLVDMLLPYFK